MMANYIILLTPRHGSMWTMSFHILKKYVMFDWVFLLMASTHLVGKMLLTVVG
jgi:hypothetical protein